MAVLISSPELSLPWQEGWEDRWFKRIAYAFMIIFMIAGFVLNQMTLPEVEKRKLEDVAPRLAKLILEKKKIPPPPPPPPPKKEVKEPDPKKEKEVKKEVIPPKPLPKEDKRAAARKKAMKSGLMSMQDELADLRDSFDFSDIGDLPQQKAGNEADDVVSTQDFLSASANKGSGGIKTNTLTRKISRSELAQKSTAQVTSTIQNQEQIAKLSAPKSSRSAIRSQEEIERVFQKNKGSIFNIYNRALRKDPTLQGKVVLELTIAPDGTVTSCKILSSELNNASLEKRLVSKVKQFKFANKKVPVITVTYPIDFLPS